MPSDGEIEDQTAEQSRRTSGLLKRLGLGVVTGAADDDPSAIGTYASAGAALGPSFLWTAPATFPMMFVVVYLSAKLGQVTGRGLFLVIKENYPRWVLYPTLFGALIGNTIEAAADIGGMAAAINLLLPVPHGLVVLLVSVTVLLLQILGSYALLRRIFRWLALSLLAYAGAAVLAKPEIWPVLKGTLVPTIQFSREFLSMLVAVIGTTLSAYLYTWQSNQEVEEEIAHGRTRLAQREGATDEELKSTQSDVLVGMLFSNIIMYFIILATSATLFKAGQHEVSSAAQAVEALRPIAGEAAAVLFAVGIIAVGFLAVPIMTTGAAYDLAQSFGWNHSRHAPAREAMRFNIAVAAFTLIAASLNFLGFNPMKALVWSAIVQGFSTPFLMLLIMLMTNNRDLMGDQVNSRGINWLGWATTAVIFAASAGLVLTWVL